MCVALVLIPCSKKKQISNPGVGANIIPGMVPLRKFLYDQIIQTPELAERPENRQGILNPQAPRTLARMLYCGKLHRDYRQSLFKKQTNVHILIVSAFYGLVRLEENIAEYVLTMANELQSGCQVY